MKAVNFCRRELDIRHTLACNLDARSSSKVWLYNHDLDSYLFFFCETKINFTEPGLLPTSKIGLFVIIVDSWKLSTSVSSSLNPPWLNYDIQRTEEGCSNVKSIVVYVDGERPLFVFIPNPKCNQDFNETILETLSMSEKTLKILLNIFDNVNAAGRPAWGQPSILK